MVAELLINAETLLKFDEKELARGLISRALAIDSSNPAALKKLSRSLVSQKDLAVKIKIQKEVCKSESTFNTLFDLANLYYQAGQDAIALEHYYDSISAASGEDVGLFEVYKNIGNILTRVKDFEGAEENFNKAYSLSPNSDVLAVNLGTLAIQQQNYEQALERFRNAVKLNPKNDKAWVGLALIHNQMGDLELAFGNIVKAVELNPTNRTAVQVLASWAARDGRYQAAISVLEDFLASVDLDEDMSFVLVHMFCQLGQFDFALFEIERVLLWNPQNSSATQLEQEIRKMKVK
jgi:tetratricopeptide (TPR) repeat protein